MKKANVTVNIDKSVFGKKDTFVVTVWASSVSPRWQLPCPVTGAPRPANAKEVRSFLGLTGWSSRFIPAYANVILPLAVMLRK